MKSLIIPALVFGQMLEALLGDNFTTPVSLVTENDPYLLSYS